MPAMTREERQQIDRQRKQMDGQGEEIRSSVPSREFRRNFDRIKWRERASREEREDG